MNINNLNDDCILVIFDHLFDLTDVQSAYKVCSRWKKLMTQRLKPVKYLLRFKDFERGSRAIKSKSVFLYEDDYRMEANRYDNPDGFDTIDGSKLSVKFLGPHNFPKLKILSILRWYFRYDNEDEPDYYSFNPGSRLFFDNFLAILSKSESIKGVCQRAANFAPYLKNLEMVSLNVDKNFYTNNDIGPKLTQIAIGERDLNEFLGFFKFFPNLRILSASFFGSQAPTVAFFPNLETIIIKEQELCRLPFAFDFFDRCPRLESAYIRSSDSSDLASIRGLTVANNRLKDLVIVLELCNNSGCSPSDLKKLLSRYRSLENFALRQCKDCRLNHVKVILEMFPKLVTLDMRYCRKIGKKVADFVDDFNKLHGRSIDFHYHPKDNVPWIQYDEDRVAVDLASNFMRNYFFKNFCDLPLLLDFDDD